MKTFLIIIICSSLGFADEPERISQIKQSLSFNELKNLSFRKIIDTVYTLSDYFVEIDLSIQLGYLHSRYDSVKTFKISTGTKEIKDGVETNTGIFVIQHKAKKWYSTQFDSTLMLHWMGFNYGIGFHALAGKSYYKYLGNRTSSHGCVRVSREDAKELFSKLEYGAPVLVHKGKTAIRISFAEKNSGYYKFYDNESLQKELKRRLTHLYEGSYLTFVNEKIIINQQNITHQGLSIGDINKVPIRQKILPEYLFIESAIPEIKAEEIPASYFSKKNLFALTD